MKGVDLYKTRRTIHRLIQYMLPDGSTYGLNHNIPIGMAKVGIVCVIYYQEKDQKKNRGGIPKPEVSV